MQEIKRLGILSVAKISALFGVLLGLFTGIMIALAASLAPEAISANAELAAAAGLGTNSGLLSILLGPWAIVIFPIYYGVLYFVVGIIGTVIYNLFARLVGGVSVDFGTERATTKTTKAKKK